MPIETYSGPWGETVIANDVVGAEFLRRYLEAAQKMGRDGKYEALQMLIAVVRAAGGRVEVPRSYLFGGRREMRVSHDGADDNIVLEVD